MATKEIRISVKPCETLNKVNLAISAIGREMVTVLFESEVSPAQIHEFVKYYVNREENLLAA